MSNSDRCKDVSKSQLVVAKAAAHCTGAQDTNNLETLPLSKNGDLNVNDLACDI